MRRYARIEGTTVRETIEIADDMNISEMFHPSLDWRPAPDGCAVGWVVHDGQIVAPDCYKVRRAAGYPPFEDLADAMVKIHAPDPETTATGEEQLQRYCEECLAVKARYPKVEV